MIDRWKSLDIEEKIRAAMKHTGAMQKQLAERLGIFQQSFSRKLKTRNFTLEELEEMAQEMGGHFRAYFVFGDEEDFDDDAWRF